MPQDSLTGKHKIDMQEICSPKDIADLMRQCFEPGSQEIWSEQNLSSFLDQPGTSVRLALVREDTKNNNSPEFSPIPVGYAICRRAGDECELISIAVLPSFRQCGIGFELLQQIIRDSFRANIRSVFLEVQKKNQAAHKLYQKYHFDTVGYRKHYYKLQSGSFADALIMRLEVSKLP